MKKYSEKNEYKVLRVKDINVRRSRRDYFYKIVEFNEVIIHPENQKKDIVTGVTAERCFWPDRTLRILNRMNNQI